MMDGIAGEYATRHEGIRLSTDFLNDKKGQLRDQFLIASDMLCHFRASASR